MATLTQHGLTNIDMRSLIEVNHLSQAGVPTASSYSWLTSSPQITIHAFGLLDDFTSNATNPLGGTVHAIQARFNGQLTYDVAAMSASLVTITQAPNLEAYWRAILEGETTLFLNAGGFLAGDFVNLATGEALAGSVDVFDVEGGGGPVLSGDAHLVGDDASLTGGDDIFTLRNTGSSRISGDADSVLGVLNGGKDRIDIDNPAAGFTSVYGDAFELAFSSGGLSTGGDDTIKIIQGGSVFTLSGDFGTIASRRTAVGGNDVVDARNATGSVTVFGDAQSIDGPELDAGDDVIFGSTLSGSFLYGDGRALSSTEVQCGNDTITGGNGNDTIFGDVEVVEGSVHLIGGNDLIKGGRGNDTIEGQTGNDTIDGGLGNDTLSGGPTNAAAEVNLVAFDSVNAAVFVDLAAGFAQGQGFDTLQLFRDVLGSGLADTIAGDSVGNILTGANGNDLLNGREGNDTLSGGSGGDSMLGGAGNDRLNGGAGPDTMNGGADNDTYVNPVLGGADGDTIVEAAGGGIDLVETTGTFSLATLTQVENLTITGAASANGTGNDLSNVISGNSGVNILIGGTGNDTLIGGGGKDQLTGGKNNDTMNGGALADTFRFAVTNTGADTINGFETALDRFDLTGGTFSNRVEAAGNTTLTHAGGTILITGVVGLNLAQWNALVLPSGGIAGAGASAKAFDEAAFIPDPGGISVLLAPAFAVHHGDFL